MLRGLATFAAAALWCAAASGQTSFISQLHVVPTAQHPIGASAVAHMTLDVDPYRLRYSIAFEGLDLEPTPANRVDQNDVIGVHMHFIVPGVTGPHILNIFGVPGEEDADLAVDYENDTLSGIFDISDATIDPATGEPFPQFFFITTKIIDDWIDELVTNQLYLAVHTAGENGQALLHGDVVAVPEPAAGLLAAGLAAGVAWSRRSARHGESRWRPSWPGTLENHMPTRTWAWPTSGGGDADNAETCFTKARRRVAKPSAGIKVLDSARV